MLRQDVRYHEFAWRNSASLGWVLSNEATLKQAERLLTGRWGDAVHELERLTTAGVAP